MKFDNNKALFNIMRVEIIAPLVFISIMSISFLGVYKNSYLPLEDYQFALLFTGIFLILSYFWYSLKQSYFSIDTDGNSIIIKYFLVTPKFISTKPKMVKISKTSYVKYTIESSLYGKRQTLFLFQKTKNGIVKYPPIYITSLSAEEIKKLKIALEY